MRTILHLLLIPLPAYFCAGSFAQTPFVDVQLLTGLNFVHETDTVCPNPPIGSGSAWADYDSDGDIDLYVTSMGNTSRLYQNLGDNGDGPPDFADVTELAGVGLDRWTAGAVFIDYDNDNDHDLYVTQWGGNHLFQNQLEETGAPVFLDVTGFAGVGNADRAVTAAWADFDNDSYLDLFLAKHFDCMPNVRESRDALYKNNGDGTFTNVSHYLCAEGSLTCDQLNLGHAFTAAWFDYDNDADQDLYVGNDVVAAGYPNILWRNDGPDGSGGWIFTDVSEESGTDYSINCKGMGIGDYDNDGWLDIASSHSSGGWLMRNKGDGTFEEAAYDAGVRGEYTPMGDIAVAWATPFADFNNDQWLDLVHIRGMIGTSPTSQPDALFMNNHDGTFTDVSEGSGMDDPRRGRSASICDFDQDGFVDMFVGNYGTRVGLLHNQYRQLGNQNHWLVVTANAGHGMINNDAIGTRFYLTTEDGITQIREISSGPPVGGGDYKAAYFGMGERETGELTIRWPNGEIMDVGEVDADQHLHFVLPVVDVTPQGDVPAGYHLSQNYPNPFNPMTEIGYRLPAGQAGTPEGGHVLLAVYDLLGREIARLVDERKTPGSYIASWDATGVSSGVYYYRLQAGSFVETRKLILAR